jgi:elongation factor Ts
MAITSQMVRDLRDRTGAGMMECKKALEASNGDVREAEDHLRKQGLKSAAKKAERSTAEGRVFAVHAHHGRRAHLVGIACETDFLAKSEKFRGFVSELEQHVQRQDPTGVEDGARPLLAQRFQGEGGPVREVVQETLDLYQELSDTRPDLKRQKEHGRWHRTWPRLEPLVEQLVNATRPPKQEGQRQNGR